MYIMYVALHRTFVGKSCQRAGSLMCLRFDLEIMVMNVCNGWMTEKNHLKSKLLLCTLCYCIIVHAKYCNYSVLHGNKIVLIGLNSLHIYFLLLQ
jgi:hypothetical protein